ncbi:MAG: phosphohistidine phosphatase [Chlamydiales bacterium]|jgi:phosphohistidine phosphatase
MSTRLVAIRHAKPLSEGYAEDALRPLSEEGKSIQLRATKQLKDEGIVPTLILSSPLLRAQQTAQVITDVYNLPFEEENALGYDFNQELLLKRIPSPEENQTLFLVGHAPTLGHFINALVGENVLPYGLSKSCAAVVDFKNEVGLGQAEFVSYYQP